MEKELWKGNEAVAEAAIRAGCKYFFGYPITPQTELAAYMSRKMPQIGVIATSGHITAHDTQPVQRLSSVQCELRALLGV